jgi:hypothetical protein
MGKYEPLAARLSSDSAGEWSATFSQVEQVLGFPLPPSARNHREWWSNQAGAGHSQAKGWQNAGWQVWKVDLAEERVIFRRRPPQVEASGSARRGALEDLFEQASSYLGTNDRQHILHAALEALCQREAGRRLAALGGSMPELKAPPRRRFG